MKNKDTQNLEMIYENIFQKAGKALGFGKKPEPAKQPEEQVSPEIQQSREWWNELMGLTKQAGMTDKTEDHNDKHPGSVSFYKNGKELFSIYREMVYSDSGNFKLTYSQNDFKKIRELLQKSGVRLGLTKLELHDMHEDQMYGHLKNYGNPS